MGWQVKAVRAVLAKQGAVVAVTPVLCFVEGEWSHSTPDTYRGVYLEGTRSIKKRVTKPMVLDEAQVERLARTLAEAFPAK
jgi:hypothetical protein